jgi:hypothetical protein
LSDFRVTVVFALALPCGSVAPYTRMWTPPSHDRLRSASSFRNFGMRPAPKS